MNAPAQYVFQAEGSLKDGEENVPPQHALLRWEPGVQTVAVKCDLCDFLPEGPACVRAAQRFVAQEMPGHAATAGKMRWPRQAMA